MNKEQLQQELLAKIKGGIKPSDLKKPSKKPAKTPLSPPPIVQSDDGYESDKSDKSIPPAPPLPNKQIKELKKDIQFWTTTANTHLKNLQLAQARIANLEEQVKNQKPAKTESELLQEKNHQIEIIALENQKNLQKANKATELLNKQSTSIKKAQELIKDQADQIKALEEKNQELTKTIKDLQNQAKNKPESKDPIETKTFTCSECSQTKSQEQLSRVFGKFSFCLECSKKARQTAQQEKQTKPQPEEFICHLCSKNKTEIPNLMKLDQTLAEYQVCSECRPLAKEFNEADLITDDLWEKYPYSSASEILEKEFGITRNKEKSW